MDEGKGREKRDAKQILIDRSNEGCYYPLGTLNTLNTHTHTYRHTYRQTH